MPILQGAVLCDAAHEYGGLVSILGGFVSVLNVTQLPAVAPIWFAGRVGFFEDELAREHDIALVALGPDNVELAGVRGKMPPTPPESITHHDMAAGINVVIPLPFPIITAATYWVELRVDGDAALVRLPLKVVFQPSPAT